MLGVVGYKARKCRAEGKTFKVKCVYVTWIKLVLKTVIVAFCAVLHLHMVALIRRADLNKAVVYRRYTFLPEGAFIHLGLYTVALLAVGEGQKVLVQSRFAADRMKIIEILFINYKGALIVGRH